ncbi:MAG: hypothetical protein Q4B32_09510 [Clostridia bacterium]|nr:hypothetical protein [Clostridia bacterium]
MIFYFFKAFVSVALVLIVSFCSTFSFGEEAASADSEILSMTFTNGDRVLTVQATKPVYEAGEVYTAAFERDEETFNAMLDALLVQQGQTVEKINDLCWMGYTDGKLQASLGYSSLWSVDYLNVANDMNGILQEEDHLFDDGYMTTNQPEMCTLTPEDAGKLAVDFSMEWSHDLTFYVNRILSVIDEDRGCYMVNVRAEFQEYPIMTLTKAYSIAPQIDFHISDDGIFAFQGLFLLKEQSREPVNLVAVEDAMKNLGASFAAYSTLSDICIDEAALNYCMETTDNVHFSVRPVWCFDGTGINASDGLSHAIAFVYYADSGEFNGAYLH